MGIKGIAYTILIFLALPIKGLADAGLNWNDLDSLPLSLSLEEMQLVQDSTTITKETFCKIIKDFIPSQVYIDAHNLDYEHLVATAKVYNTIFVFHEYIDQSCISKEEIVYFYEMIADYPSLVDKVYFQKDLIYIRELSS